jgi:hypothetical protein
MPGKDFGPMQGLNEHVEGVRSCREVARGPVQGVRGFLGQIETALALGLSPLGSMLKIMNDPSEDPARRDRMAQAAPFVHARLAPKTVDPEEEQTAEQKAAAASWDELLD